MRLRIVRPLPVQLEELDVSHLRFGASYDLPSPLYGLLLASGYAVPEDGPGKPAIEALKPRPAKATTRKRKRAAK